MGLFSSIGGLLGIGNSSSSVNTSQATTIKNDVAVEVINELDFDALAEAEKNSLEFNKEMFEYAKNLDLAKMTIDQIREEEEKQLEELKTAQNAESLELSKKNRNTTIFFAVIGLGLTLWKMKKGNK